MNSGGHVRAAACASCGYPCYMVKKIIRNASVIEKTFFEIMKNFSYI